MVRRCRRRVANGGSVVVNWNAVPAPGTAALLGIAGMVTAGRKRRA